MKNTTHSIEKEHNVGRLDATAWQRYEFLKAQYTAGVPSPREYAQGCLRAAVEAGV